jgi:DNA-binding NarL/FixJ family response regulator
MSVTVQIVGNDPEFRDSLRMVLDREPDLTVFDEIGAPRSRRRLAGSSGPDVVVVDADQPGERWPPTPGRRARRGRPRVLVLLGSPRPDGVRAALAAGAAGVVGKIQPVREILSAIRVVAAGGSYVCPDLVSLNAFSRAARARLTELEYDLYEHTVRGRSEQQSAYDLMMSVRGVRLIRKSMLAKLGAKSPVDLLRLALERA